jgi:hypothetical protein
LVVIGKRGWGNEQAAAFFDPICASASARDSGTDQCQLTAIARMNSHCLKSG